MSVRVRVAADADDLRAAAALRREWKGDGVEEAGVFDAAFVAWAQSRTATHTCFIAESDGEVVGLTWLAVTDRVPAPGRLERTTGDIQSVYVTPAVRGTGAGAALLGAALDRARELGLERVVVHSSAEAVKFYRRLGFASSDRLLHLDVRLGG